MNLKKKLYSTFYLDETKTANALDLKVLSALQRVIDLTIKDKGTGVIITSLNKKTFCSGGNLQIYRGLKTKAEGLSINKKIEKTLSSFQSLPLLLIGAINGDVIGGGCEFISALDFTLATPEARFSFRQIQQNLTPGWGGASRLLKRVGPGVALDWLTSGRWVSSTEARDAGLIDSVCSETDILENADDFLEARSGLNPNLIKSVKSVVDGKPEQDIFSKLWWSEGHRAALDKGLKKS